MTPDGRIGAELDRRLARASRAFGALCCVFDDQQLSLRTRRMVYLACVVSLLLYGTECWPILRRDEHRLDAFHHQCLRILLGDQELQHISNGELRKRWGDSDLLFDVHAATAETPVAWTCCTYALGASSEASSFWLAS